MLRWFNMPNGEKVTVEEALNGAMDNLYPRSYLKVCAEERDWKGRPSTTQLINGTRLEFLRILTPYAEDPDGQAFRIVGTRGHRLLEQFAPEASFSELGLSDSDISGILDSLEEINGKWVLTDYKVWGSYKVGQAMGLEEKTRPMVDQEGNPVLYLRSGNGYKAGDPRMEKYYVENPDKVNIPETELQVNRYKYLAEKVLDIKIPELRVFFIVRDGGTIAAKSRGVMCNTKLIWAKHLSEEFVSSYFNTKKELLLNSVEGYIRDFEKKYSFPWNKDFDPDDELVEKHCPPVCSNQENWNDRRCQGYCPVSDLCLKLQSESVNSPDMIDKQQKAKELETKVIERFQYLEMTE